MKFLYSILLLVVVVVSAHCETCQLPEVISSSYSVANEKLSDDTAFLVEFELKCVNNLKGISLYADVGGKQFPVTKSAEGDKYQVSWVAKGEIVPSQTIDVKLYDEDGFGKLKKALRSEEEEVAVKPLATVELEHPGSSTCTCIKSEILALITASLIFYIVSKERSAVIA